EVFLVCAGAAAEAGLTARREVAATVLLSPRVRDPEAVRERAEPKLLLAESGDPHVHELADRLVGPRVVVELHDSLSQTISHAVGFATQNRTTYPARRE